MDKLIIFTKEESLKTTEYPLPYFRKTDNGAIYFIRDQHTCVRVYCSSNYANISYSSQPQDAFNDKGVECHSDEFYLLHNRAIETISKSLTPELS